MVAGQSNAVGQGSTLNEYSGGKAGMFDTGWPWKGLVDPTHPIGSGSVWPLIATSYFGSGQTTPIGYVTTARNSHSSADWLPGTTAYRNMISQVQASGGTSGLKAVLWWQGEADALQAIPQATYHANLATIAAAIQADLGVPMIVAKLQNCTGVLVPANLAAINAAIEQGYTDIPNVRRGPDLSDIVTDDSVHLISDAKVQLAAARWWTAIATEFGW